MHKVVVYGASDDLLEIEVWHDDSLIQRGEMGNYAGDAVIYISADGDDIPVRVWLTDDAEWEVSYTEQGDEVVHVEAVGDRPDLCSYSQVLNVEFENKSDVSVVDSSNQIIL